MSNDNQEEDDSGLIALRKELLSDLLKKKSIVSIDVNENDQNKSDANLKSEKQLIENTPVDNQNESQEYKKEEDNNNDDDDEDLESLRLNALRAKRKWTNISTENSNKNLPGRFRYDRDSEEEEEDEDDDEFDNFKYKKQYNNLDDGDYQYEQNEDNNYEADSMNLDKTKYQNKYEVYKMEYSKRYTSNDEYEPSESAENLKAIKTNSNDLREYLISKRNGSFKNLEENNTEKMNNYIGNNNDHIDDLNYSQPITRPIDVSREEIVFNNQKYRYNNYHNRKSNNYHQKATSFNKSYDKNNNKDAGSLSDNRDDDCEEDRDNSDTEVNQSDNEDDTDSNKKLKSVVIVSNNTNRQQSVEKSRHYSSYRSHYRRSTSPSYSRRSRRY